MASRRFRIEFTVDMDCWDANDIEAFAIQELTSMSPYPRDIEFSEVGWHTEKPTEEGWYLVYYLRQPFPNEKESVELYHQLLSPNNEDGYIKWVDIDGEVVFGEEEVVRWQRIEPYTEAIE